MVLSMHRRRRSRAEGQHKQDHSPRIDSPKGITSANTILAVPLRDIVGTIDRNAFQIAAGVPKRCLRSHESRGVGGWLPDS